MLTNMNIRLFNAMSYNPTYFYTWLKVRDLNGSNVFTHLNFTKQYSLLETNPV